MKKNYLGILVASLLVTTGCGSTNNSSKLNSVTSSVAGTTSSSVVVSSTVVASSSETVSSSTTWNGEFGTAADHIVGSYTLSYTEGDESYSNKYEEGNYFSARNEQGFFKVEDKAYLYYLNDAGKATYSTNSEMGAWADVAALIEFGSTFASAKWNLVDGDATNATFITQDANVAAAAGFVTDANSKNPVKFVTATVVKGKMTGFTTLNASEVAIATATVKRIGSTYASYNPVQSEELDSCQSGEWTIIQGEKLGAAGEKVTINGTTLVAGAATYTYVAPVGDGFYYFEDAAGNGVETICMDAVIYYFYYEAGNETPVEQGALGSYVTIFGSVAEQLGYIFVSEDELGESLADVCFTGTKGYVLGKISADGQSIEEAAIISVFPTIDQLLTSAQLGILNDTTLYNGCAIAGYIYGPMIMSGYIGTEEGAEELWYDVTSYLDASTIDFDLSKYPTAEAGQDSQAYLEAYAAAKGYNLYNKDTAPESYAANIERFLSNYAQYGVVDVLVLTKVSQGTSMYTFLFVCDTEENAAQFRNSFGKVVCVAAGYFALIGEAYEALSAWAASAN